MFAVVAIDVTESSWALKHEVIFVLSNNLTILSSNAPINKLGWLIILRINDWLLIGRYLPNCGQFDFLGNFTSLKVKMSEAMSSDVPSHE
jgi:hypothetical protein